jgi:DNA polymerase III epsilon subunit-like protein
MEAAEIIAGHNVVGFDLRKCNSVFLRNNLTPIVDKKTIDTLKLARSKLSNESNSLNYLSKYYGFSGKDEITREDWRLATAGHKQTLKKIEKYCMGDVINGKALLEKFTPLANKKYNFGAIKKTPFSLLPVKPDKRGDLK